MSVMLIGMAGAAPFAYVTDGNNVQVVDMDTNGIVRTIDMGSMSYDIAADPEGDNVYVTHHGYTQTLSVIKTADYSVSTINLDSGASDVALSPDGNTAYVTGGAYANKVFVVDTSSKTIVNSIEVGADPLGIALTADGKKAVVACSGSVAIIDIAADTLWKTIPASAGYYPQDVAVNPSGTKAYVTESDGATAGVLSIIDLSSGTVVNTIGVGCNPRGVAVSPDGMKAYVVNWADNEVVEIDAMTGAIINAVSVSSHPANVALTADGKKLLVTAYADGYVDIVDTASASISSEIAMSMPYGVAILPSSQPAAIMIEDFQANVTYGIEGMVVGIRPYVSGSQAAEWYWTFTKSGTRADDYLKRFDAVESADEWMLVATFNKAGTYDISLTVIDADGNSDTLIKTGYITVSKDKEKNGKTASLVLQTASDPN